MYFQARTTALFYHSKLTHSTLDSLILFIANQKMAINKTIISIALLYVSSIAAQAQNETANWIFGNQSHRTVLFHFEDSLESITTDTLDFEVYQTFASISDSVGDLLFYTNGYSIINKDFELMENGDSIHYGYWWEQLSGDEGGGHFVNDASLILPVPENPDQYMIVYSFVDSSNAFLLHVKELRYALVDLSYNNGLGKVLEKEIVLLNDTLAAGKLDAVRHANGKDWWIVITDTFGNKFFKFLLTDSGFIDYGTQFVSDVVIQEEGVTGGNIATFSPNGKNLALYNENGGTAWVELYDFDRCTGMLSNYRYKYLVSQIWGGIAFSTNSRFLYVCNSISIFQIDLESPDPFANLHQIAWSDMNVGGNFNQMHLAPDGKIYVVPILYSDDMHIIHAPDLPGDSCNFEMYAIQMPHTYAGTVPNFPNFELGSMAGSTCDTIFQTPPIAAFTYLQDSNKISFKDVSHYFPNGWSWNFGDGGNSSTQNTSHTYATPGNYTVCLTAQNLYGTDIYCEEIQVDFFTKVRDINLVDGLRIYPNPTRDQLRIETLNKTGSYTLFNTVGQVLLQGNFQGEKVLDVSGILRGMYWLEIELDGAIFVEKIVIQ